MFKDIKMSEATMQEFRGTGLSRALQVELHVKVLTTGHWPNESHATIPTQSLPREIQTCMSNFNRFYLNKHTGRLLHWKPYLGSADVRAIFGENKRHEFTMSTYQLAIILAFNDVLQISYQDLQNMTQIPELEFKCNMIGFL